MRDLGLLGENTFSLLCANVGLVPNGSKIDKTGWDFFVEFPFSSGVLPHEIHKSAFECKVQVKATDQKRRKISVTLSNLRRLITAQMPAFFVFIEFDGRDSAQRVFVVHIDNNLISKVLKRMHQIEQSDKDNNFNKRTMTIHYDDSNLLEKLNGECLKQCFLSHIGVDIAKYIASKKTHLESAGYEDGYGQVTFTTTNEDDLKKLIDVSLGIERQAGVSTFKGVDTRFGIQSKKPLFDADCGKLEMPGLKPNTDGKIRFREDRLSPWLSFDAKLYNSVFNPIVPDKLKKMRIVGDFFDIRFNPFNSSANYSFSFGEGIRLEVKKFRDAIRLLNLFTTPGKEIFAEFIFDGMPKLKVCIEGSKQEYNYSTELQSLNSAIKLISEFDVTDVVDISLEEISKFGSQICYLHKILDSSPHVFQAEFEVDGNGYDPNKPTCCIFNVGTPIGSHLFGIILVITGSVLKIEGDRFRLISNDIIVEKRIVSEKGDVIPDETLAAAIKEIEDKYDGEFSVVTISND